MAAHPEAARPSVLARAARVVDVGLQACAAYGRADLGDRLAATKRRLADPAVHIVVAGEFKQGKSSLVNALLGANVCPVDDDVATAVPTYVRYGQQPRAELLLAGGTPGEQHAAGTPGEQPSGGAPGEPAGALAGEPRRQEIPLDQVRRYAVENRDPAPAERVIGVEVQLPRTMLANGMVVVDTPGVGGLGSAHAAASLGAVSLAQAVLFVTDASQELTRTELDFLRRARELCDTVVCVLTKIDFYPAWRRIRDINLRHLSGGLDVPVLAVSSALRARAVKANDARLNVESGFAELVQLVTRQVGENAADRLAAEAADEVTAVSEQIIGQFEAERAALADPAAAQAVIDQLNETKRRVESLRSAAAKWSQTLNDGIADLSADIDHDLRTRIRKITQEADDAIENIDPADVWAEMESWLQSRVSYEVLANYTMLRARATELSEQVAQHFREASGDMLHPVGVYNPAPVASQVRIESKIELEKMKAGKQAMVALRSAYGGAIMFTMLSSLAGIALGPLSIGIGLVMGRKGLRDEKKRQVAQRRAQAKNAMRRYCDEVNFVMGKDSRDTLRRIQRQLRDHYSALAEELTRSNAEALTAAAEAARRSQADREKRLRDLDAELARLRQLVKMAAEVVG